MSNRGKGFAQSREYASECGKRGGAAVKEKYGSMYYSVIAARGAARTYARYGSEHYVKIGRIGGLRRAENIKARKEAEEATKE